MKHLFFILMLSSSLLKAQFFLDFALDAAPGSDINSTASDAAGNVYVTGAFYGSTNFDPAQNASALTPVGASAFFVSKYDVNGAYQWAFGVGGAGTAQANKICTDASGNVYVTGFFTNLTDFDPGPGTATLSPVTTTAASLFVAKYSSSGQYLWAFTVSGNAVSHGNGLCLDGAGNVLVTGDLSGTGDFDPSGSVASLTAGGTKDAFLAKYTAGGAYVWAFRIGGTNVTYGLGIGVDVIGNCYLTGNFGGVCDFNPAAATNSLASAGNTDAFVAKYSAGGIYRWAFPVAGSGVENGNAISVMAPGSFYLTGSFGGTADFDGSAAVSPLTSNGTEDAYLAQYDSSGVFQWSFQLGDSNPSQGKDICATASGDVYITGFFNGSIDFDPAPNATATAVMNSNNGSNDIFIASYNMYGQYKSAIQVGSLNNDEGRSIRVDAFGNSYIGGEFSNVVDFDTSSAVVNLTAYLSNLGSDGFVVKYSPPCSAPVAPAITSPSASLSSCAYRTGTLQVSASTFVNWYANASGGTSLGSSSTFITPTLVAVNTPSVFTYYAEALTCTTSSVRTPVNFTVNPLPSLTAAASPACIGKTSTITASGASTYTWSTGSNASSFQATLPASTPYTVTGTGSNLCKNTFSLLVVVNPLPTVAVVPSSSAVCAGQGLTLTAIGASTYAWGSGFTGSPLVFNNLTASMAYSVLGTDANMCSSSATGSVAVNALPTMSVLTLGIKVCAGQSATLLAVGAITNTWSTGAVGAALVVTPPATSLYAVVGTDQNGCHNAASITITVNPLPVISINPASSTVCRGKSTGLTATGAVFYTWSTGSTASSIAVTPSVSPTLYNVMGTDQNLCTATVAAQAVVGITDLPVIAFSSSVICTGQSATISLSGADTYTWSNGSVLPYQVVSPTANTVYSVTGTLNNCTDTASFTQQVSACVGFASTSLNDPQIRLYPNPSHGLFTLELPGTLNKVIVYNALGERIWSEALNDGVHTIRLGNVPKGVYVVSVVNQQARSNHQIIVE